jgi:hypothetical protein
LADHQATPGALGQGNITLISDSDLPYYYAGAAAFGTIVLAGGGYALYRRGSLSSNTTKTTTLGEGINLVDVSSPPEIVANGTTTAGGTEGDGALYRLGELPSNTTTAQYRTTAGGTAGGGALYRLGELPSNTTTAQYRPGEEATLVESARAPEVVENNVEPEQAPAAAVVEDDDSRANLTGVTECVIRLAQSCVVM